MCGGRDVGFGEPGTPRVRVIEGNRPRVGTWPAGSAALKIRRAQEHLHEFRARLQEFYDRVPWDLAPVRDGNDLAIVLASHSSVPDVLSLVAGDLLHNARSALDCLVMELAERGLGSLGRGPQTEREERSLSFPIGEKPLSASLLVKLAHFLPPSAVECIQLLQPVETTRRALAESGHEEVDDELVARHLHHDLLLRLNHLDNWDKHRRTTFAFLVPDSVSPGVEGDGLHVVSRPGTLDNLRGVRWVGRPEPELPRIDDPQILAQMAAQITYPDYDIHFSWWPLSVGDEIGRFIRHTGTGPVPDITVEASLRLTILEPLLLAERSRMATPADRLLADFIDEVVYVAGLLDEVTA